MTARPSVYAAACGRPEAAEELTEEFDPDSVIESERLARVLVLLGLPRWLVAVSWLPRDVPARPRACELIRVGTGVPGLLGRRARPRRGRRPPASPAAGDPRPPRGGGDPEWWAY